MYRQFLILFIVIWCFSCTPDTKSEKQTAANLTEDFSKPVRNESSPVTFIIANGMNGEFVSVYRDLDFATFTKEKHLYSDESNDTLRIAVQKAETLYVTSKFSARDTLHVKNGDTIFLNLHDEKLTVSHSSFKNIPILNLKNDAIDSLTRPFYYVDYKAPFKLQSDKFQKVNPIYPLRIDYANFKSKSSELIALGKALIERYKVLANQYDSLQTVHNEKSAYYELLKNELNYNTFFELNRLYGYSKNDALKNMIISELFFNNDSHQKPFLYKKLNTFIQRIVLKGKKIKQKFKLKVDYKTAYDSLPDYLKNEQLLPLAKIVAIKGFAEYGASKEELSKIIARFSNEYPNDNYKVFTAQLKADYELVNNNDRNDIGTVYLKDFFETQTQLKTFIKQNEGNVIYMDVWASWCAPCRAVMEDSRKLAAAYKNKNVVFAYISIDRNATQWKAAAKAENLDSKISFLALNYPEATFYKDLHLNTIPRYLLFNPQGELIHEQAPGPDNKEIRTLIDNYLIE